MVGHSFIFMKYDIKIFMLIISYFIFIMIDLKIYVLINPNYFYKV
jgi:hypothetical protein